MRMVLIVMAASETTLRCRWFLAKGFERTQGGSSDVMTRVWVRSDSLTCSVQIAARAQKVKRVQSTGKLNQAIARRGVITRRPPPSAPDQESGPGE